MLKRPIVIFCLSLIVGIITAYNIKLYFWIVLFIGLWALFFLRRCVDRMVTAIILGAILFYTIGSLEFLHIDSIGNKFEQFSGKYVTVFGHVCSEVEMTEKKASCEVKVDSITIDSKTQKRNGKILFSCPSDAKALESFCMGREIKFSGTLSTPRKKRNPGGFDYQKYFFQKGIVATIFSTESNIKTFQITNKSYLAGSALATRNKILNIIEYSLPSQQAGLLKGMLIGYKKSLSKEVQEDFNMAGITHIMAVSGANVVFIVIPVLFLLKLLLVKRKIANIIIICILIEFTFITGFEPSVVRAVIMAIVVLIGQILFREPDVFASISVACIMLLLCNPYNLFSAGFQLSFIATLSLVLFYEPIKNKLENLWENASNAIIPHFPQIYNTINPCNIECKKRSDCVSSTRRVICKVFSKDTLLAIISATLAAQIGVIPILILHSNEICTFSLFSNLLVIPICGLITISGIIMVALGMLNLHLAQIIGYISYGFLTFILLVSKGTSHLPFSTLKIATPTIFQIVLYYLIIMTLLLDIPIKKTNVTLSQYFTVSSIIMIFCLTSILVPRDMEAVFLDVGEGDCTFIRTRCGSTILVDGGEKSEGRDTIIKPLLMKYGIFKIDVMIASHPHSDHIGGLTSVIENFKVDKLIVPKHSSTELFEELLNVSERKKVEVISCKRGDVINFSDGTRIDFLYPNDTNKGGAGDNLSNSSVNNQSSVFKLTYGNIRVLFTGDCENEAEEELVRRGDIINSDILKVAHHGSSTSTTAQLLDRVRPKVAIISVGKNNFGHPSYSVINRIKGRNIKIFRTDINGAIVVRTNGSNLYISGFCNYCRGEGT